MNESLMHIALELLAKYEDAVEADLQGYEDQDKANDMARLAGEVNDYKRRIIRAAEQHAFVADFNRGGDIMKRVNAFLAEKWNELNADPDDEPKDARCDYTPACPLGYDDCVVDPAYIEHHYPGWYRKLYGSKTIQEAVKEHCKPNLEDGYCDDFEDEDK